VLEAYAFEPPGGLQIILDKVEKIVEEGIGKVSWISADTLPAALERLLIGLRLF
jgi:hypothetical protein